MPFWTAILIQFYMKNFPLFFIIFYFIWVQILFGLRCGCLLKHKPIWPMKLENWETGQFNENHIGSMGRWFSETSEKQCGCLRVGCWNNLDWWVPFGQHVCALWNAWGCCGGPHETDRHWMVRFLWSYNDRASCPCFKEKRKERKKKMTGMLLKMLTSQSKCNKLKLLPCFSIPYMQYRVSYLLQVFRSRHIFELDTY